MGVKSVSQKAYSNFTNPMKSKSAIIIGTGITGLTTALYLKRAGWKITLLEKQNRWGGSIQSFQENGFVYESGPNTGMVSYPEVVDLLESLGPNFKYEPANAEAKRRWIWKNGRWYRLPSSLKGGITTPLFKWRDKIRILLEPFIKRGRNPNETLDRLVERRMGKSFLHYAVDPFILGVYAGDPSKLVTRYALPNLYNLEQKYGSFIKGSIRESTEPKTEKEKKVTKEMFSIPGGLERLIEAMVEEIGHENILLNCENLTVYPQESEYTVSYEISKDQFQQKSAIVISTVGAHEVHNLLPFLNQKEKESIKNLSYARVVQVSIGFKKWRGIPIRAFGGLIPHKENRQILGILFPSSFLANRAPKGGALLSIFLGGDRRPEVINFDDATIKKMVLDELKKMMLIPVDEEPDLFKIFRHHHAIPQYGISTSERLQTVENIETQFPGIILAGNLRDGIGMADRIKQGVQISKMLTQRYGMMK